MSSLSTMTYPIDIPSIAAFHPTLTNNLNLVNSPFFQGLFVNHLAGTPLDPLDALRAEQTARILGLLAELDQPAEFINIHIVETARNRAHIVRSVHATMEFGIAPGFPQMAIGLQQLQQNCQQLNTRLNRLEAFMHNHCITSQNQAGRYPFMPLQKVIPDDGHALAVPLAINPAMIEALQEYQPHGAVGGIPPTFNSDIDNYRHIDILRLVVFYNDNFGIDAQDLLPERKRKLTRWLVELMV